MPITSSSSSSSFKKHAPSPLLFTSFDVPEWTVPSSALCDAVAQQYTHLFTSFEVPQWMLQGARVAQAERGGDSSSSKDTCKQGCSIICSGSSVTKCHGRGSSGLHQALHQAPAQSPSHGG